MQSEHHCVIVGLRLAPGAEHSKPLCVPLALPVYQRYLKAQWLGSIGFSRFGDQLGSSFPPAGLAGANRRGWPRSHTQALGWKDQAFSPCGGHPPPGGQAWLFAWWRTGPWQEGRRIPQAQGLNLYWSPFCEVLSATGKPEVEGQTLLLGEGRPGEERACSDGREYR